MENENQVLVILSNSRFTEKEEKRKKELEEGKPEKKKRRVAPKRNKNQGAASTAGTSFAFEHDFTNCQTPFFLFNIDCQCSSILINILSGEAIEKMLQEKRISSKINYEVLRSLNVGVPNNVSSCSEVPTHVESDSDRVKTEKTRWVWLFVSTSLLKLFGQFYAII